jgi:SNF2 family DNA or RNA helicase
MTLLQTATSREIFNPHPYQRYCIHRVVTDPILGLFLDMGLGKTVITLTGVNDLMYNRFAIRKTLVVAPKKVAEATWTDEAARWEHLRLLRVQTVLGTERQRLRALATPADVYVIGRDNVQWLVDHYRQAWPFDMVVLDELSSFKNPSSVRFKSMRRVRPKIQRVLGLTGTPAPNGLLDLWAQVYLLDQGQRLYSTFGQFRARYFDYIPYSDYGHGRYTPKLGAEDAIPNAIEDICISMKAKDYLELPELVQNRIPIELDAKTRKAYRDFERQQVLELDGEVITAAQAATVTNKLLQFCAGAVYDENRQVHEIHDAKIEAFLELVESLQGKPLLVFYGYLHDRDRILRALKKFRGLEVRELKGPQDYADWNARKIHVGLAHPASTAYGLNLQRGGNHICWFTLPWSLELYEQAQKRLHRQGQDEKVIEHVLMVRDSMDEEVAKRLESKAWTQRVLIEALKARIGKNA